MTNEILFAKEGRDKLMVGVNKLADAVKTTLGAKGKNVIIGTEFGLPQITKDGVTVARSINLYDYVENMGASLVKEVANKTAEIAGDATTTATVLAQAILTRGIEQLNNGENQLHIKSGIDKASKAVVAELKKLSKKIENDKLADIATISANNDAVIGKLIAEAVSHVGIDGIIAVNDSGTVDTNLTLIDGQKFNQGFIHPMFVLNTNKNKVELTNPLILLYDKELSLMQDLIPVLHQVLNDKRDLLIICEDMKGEALKSLIQNNIQGILKVCVVKSPAYGTNKHDMMNDLALSTGGLYITEDIGIPLKDISIANLGQAKKVTITKDRTTIIGGNSDKAEVEERIKALKELIEEPTATDVSFLKHRLANLNNSVASINVGGATEIEVSEKKDRIDDALRATLSSLEEGYVAGGGVTLLRCLNALKSLKVVGKESVGVAIIAESIKQPFIQIMTNAGLAELVDGMMANVISNRYGMGYNVKTDKFENLLQKGIIDPTKATRVALENAVSIAGTFLTTDCIISNSLDNG